MSNPFDDKNFDSSAEMTSMTIDWGKPGDYIMGTFIKARHNIETKFGPKSIYQILAEKGSYHKLIGEGRLAKPEEKATAIEKGDTWDIWGRNDIFNGQINSLKAGQVIKIAYESDEEGANGPWKKIKIYAPKNNEGKPVMNEDWVAENSEFGNFDN